MVSRPHDSLTTAVGTRLRQFNDRHGRWAPRIVIAGPFESQAVFSADGRVKLAPNLNGFAVGEAEALAEPAALAVFADFGTQPIWQSPPVAWRQKLTCDAWDATYNVHLRQQRMPGMRHPQHPAYKHANVRAGMQHTTRAGKLQRPCTRVAHEPVSAWRVECRALGARFNGCAAGVRLPARFMLLAARTLCVVLQLRVRLRQVLDRAAGAGRRHAPPAASAGTRRLPDCRV